MNACGLENSTGIALQRKDPVTNVYEVVAGINSFPEIGLTASTGQCTNVTGTGWEEFFKSGKFQQGEMALGLNMITANPSQVKLYSDFKESGANSKITWRLQFPNASASIFEFAALVTGWGIAIPALDSDEVITRPVTLRPTGEPTWTE